MNRIPSIPSRNGERGIALVVVLILLLVMSMLALVSLRSTLMEERMSANMADRSASFQAAEAALRQGEQFASGKPPVPGSGCLNGLCAIPAPTDAPRWKTAANWNTAKVVDIDMGTHSVGAKYIVELIAVNVEAKGQCLDNQDPNATCTGTESRYRITALSEAAGRSSVMLQTNYAVP
ncbi:pilus assembly PilX family protein [Noviluteimonas gilva]|uniref:Pilus assembly protein n=1 Tax=Noviluteimonas gilva TaxID=2682097 RepID=A0A7C9HMD3_9GAMM|nr:PilX N-terminal domain-containing pilus assembly protein [Lysobacter gilvus]MUV14415.1 pilus assembly protein [Lysobacter gilvus]